MGISLLGFSPLVLVCGSRDGRERERERGRLLLIYIKQQSNFKVVHLWNVE